MSRKSFPYRALTHARAITCTALLGCITLACSGQGDDSSNDASEAGGATTGGSSTGGNSSGGGPTSTTGGSSSGGTAATGGTASTSGGAGGSVGVGGAPDTGGTSSGGTSSGGTGGTGGTPPVLAPLTVYVAGDSTVSTYADTASTKDQAGWGQMLHEHFSNLVTVDNRAVGGRTSRRFIEEGRLDDIWSDIDAGDYLFVQFGTNDSNKTATYTINNQTIPYYLAPNTDFKTYLMQYVTGARQRGATPVLVTPPPRNSAYCTGGNGTGAYAQAMRDLGAAEDVTVLDLNERSVTYLKAICPAPTPEDFFLLRTDGTVDGTHFQENGARHLATFIALELEESAIPLAAYLK